MWVRWACEEVLPPMHGYWVGRESKVLLDLQKLGQVQVIPQVRPLVVSTILLHIVHKNVAPVVIGVAAIRIFLVGPRTGIRIDPPARGVTPALCKVRVVLPVVALGPACLQLLHMLPVQVMKAG